MTQTTTDRHVRLGINIDHVATLRNARGGGLPDPVRAAKLAIEAGADGITAHLREDRRHICDEDIARLKDEVSAPLNLEMAATGDMIAIALKMRPHACCLVPERRAELTTEGGLDVAGGHNTFAPSVRKLLDGGIRVSLFIDAHEAQVEAAARIKATIVEFHTGPYCHAFVEGQSEKAAHELGRLARAAQLAHGAGLEVHAGHGLDFDTAAHVAALPHVVELNIGHFLIGEAVFLGLKSAIETMRHAIDKARA